MTRAFLALLLLVGGGFWATNSFAQTPAPGTPLGGESDLLTLTHKIEEQNTKIDALSQQILKLQHEVERGKGMSTTGVAEETVQPSPAAPVAGAATHVVTRGETLTSIAKMHKVGIEELQKFNHIENDRKLQIGQTLNIPGAPTPTPVATPLPNE